MPIPQRGCTSSAPLSLNSGEQEFLFDPGRICFVCEKRMERTLRFLQEFYYSGSKLLCVTRLHPDLLQERLPGMAMETTWLCERNGPNSIPPNQLHRISYRIEGFLLDNRSSVILLEGIEYLALFNDVLRLQTFVEQINDQIMMSKAVMLIPLDPDSMDTRTIARLTRYAEIVIPQSGI